MKRVEIIANQSVETDIRDLLAGRGLALQHTLFHGVHGEGRSGPRRGDGVWPEENFAMVVYCSEDDARAIVSAVEEVKNRFPGEGIQVFSIG